AARLDVPATTHLLCRPAAPGSRNAAGCERLRRLAAVPRAAARQMPYSEHGVATGRAHGRGPGVAGAGSMPPGPGTERGSWPAARFRRPTLRSARSLIALAAAVVVVLAAAGLLLAWRDYSGRRAAVLVDTRQLARAA